jgi:hypothetical protein
MRISIVEDSLLVQQMYGLAFPLYRLAFPRREYVLSDTCMFKQHKRV